MPHPAAPRGTPVPDEPRARRAPGPAPRDRTLAGAGYGDAVTTSPPAPALRSRQWLLVRRQLAASRPSWRWLRGSLRSFATSFLALTASLWLLPGTQVTRGAESVAALAVGVLAVGALVRPLITRLTVLTGVVGLLLAGFLAQAVVLGIALALVPTVEPFSAGQVVLAAWAAAVAAAAVNWLFDASSDEAFLGQLLGRAVRRTRRAGSEGPGLLVVQLDGVSEPLLRQAITAGALPTVSRWLRSGSHRMRGWHTGVPATTPAGQAVLLHGDVTAVPGFRWWDKGRGRLLTASRPVDAAEVEAAMSDGRGLLADDGASVSNLFSGDAPTSVLTISDGRLPGSDRGAASYMALRSGFLRSLTLLGGQVVTEWHQARRQRTRDVRPRVGRGGAFLLLRGLTTVVLRDLNLAVVTEQLTRGTPVVFVDFVDYDEVAHHAGPTRPESMRTLENLDRVLQFLDQVCGEVGRRYELAVVSDHGQAQGTTFLQLTGRTLEDVVLELADAHAGQGAAAPAPRSPADRATWSEETWVPASMLLAGATGSGRALTRATRSVAERPRRRAGGTPGGTPDGGAGGGAPAARLLVAVSGGLAHVYRTDRPGRLTHDDLAALHPHLVAGLAAHPGVGGVVTRLSAPGRRDGDLRVDGPGGWCVLRPGHGVVDGEGADPLATYGPRAAADLLDLERRDHVGDLVVLGAHDPALGEVVAFEELVGSHGGLGGWQTEALLLHPADWEVPTTPLTGLDVHRTLVARLERLGLRADSPTRSAGSAGHLGGTA